MICVCVSLSKMKVMKLTEARNLFSSWVAVVFFHYNNHCRRYVSQQGPEGALERVFVTGRCLVFLNLRPIPSAVCFSTKKENDGISVSHVHCMCTVRLGEKTKSCVCGYKC